MAASSEEALSQSELQDDALKMLTDRLDGIAIGINTMLILFGTALVFIMHAGKIEQGFSRRFLWRGSSPCLSSLFGYALPARLCDAVGGRNPPQEHDEHPAADGPGRRGLEHHVVHCRLRLRFRDWSAPEQVHRRRAVWSRAIHESFHWLGHGTLDRLCVSVGISLMMLEQN